MSQGKWHVKVSSRCVGAGLCVAVAPEHFQFSSGRAQSTYGTVENEGGIGLINTAAEVCPVAAIALSRG